MDKKPCKECPWTKEHNSEKYGDLNGFESNSDYKN